MPNLRKPAQAFESTPRPPIPLKRVRSDQIGAVGYDPISRTLAVQFKPRGLDPVSPVYHYPDVAPECYADFLAADSLGTFHGMHFKDLPFKKYAAERLPPLEPDAAPEVSGQ